MKTRIAIAVGGVILGVSAAAASRPAQQGPEYEYAVKFLCSAPVGIPERPNPGFMTRVNVHNPNDTGYAMFRKKVALTVPPGRQRPGRVIKIEVIDTLRADEALTIDCPDLVGRGLPPSFEGFLVIHSTKTLDVIAVYTVPGGIDVERATERRMP